MMLPGLVWHLNRTQHFAHKHIHTLSLGARTFASTSLASTSTLVCVRVTGASWTTVAMTGVSIVCVECVRVYDVRVYVLVGAVKTPTQQRQS